MNDKFIPKFGRLYDQVTSRENVHKQVDVDGELIFFKDDNLQGAVTRGGISIGTHGQEW